MDRKKGYVFLVIFLIFGLAVGLQVKSVFTEKKQKTESALNVEKLQTLLNNETEKGKVLKESISEMEKKKTAMLKTSAEGKNDEYLKSLLEELDIANLNAGLTDVKGPGIILRLNDAIPQKSDTPELLIIHDSDIIKIVNELKIAGAQAISINDERVISTSETICAGPTIKINKNRYPVPYVIKVIGDPDLLSKKMDESFRIIRMRGNGIRVGIEKSNEILIPKYEKSIKNLTSGLEVSKK